MTARRNAQSRSVGPIFRSYSLDFWMLQCNIKLRRRALRGPVRIAVMKTYSLELRHAPSKNRLNALENNRLPPLRLRLKTDAEAIVWARTEAYQFADRNRGYYFQYIEAALLELLPINASGGDDYRRLGRWVINHDGVNWRETPQKTSA